MSNHTYTFEEFERHFGDYGVVRQYQHVAQGSEQVEIGESRDFEMTLLRVVDYMMQVYSDEDEAQHKAAMFVMMQMYLAEHAHEFDQGTLAVGGSEQGLVGRRLLRAVHHVFTTKLLSQVGRPSPQEVIALAQSYE